MSLKGFHIVFITFSMLCAIGFGFWAQHQYAAHQELGYLITAISSYGTALGLFIYEFYIFKVLNSD